MVENVNTDCGCLHGRRHGKTPNDGEELNNDTRETDETVIENDRRLVRNIKTL